MGRPAHFEIQAKNMERAKKFYQNVFGWDIQKWQSPGTEVDYWLIMTGKMSKSPDVERDVYGIDGGMGTDFPMKDLNAYVVTMDVMDLDETCQKVEENDGKLVTEKMTVPGVGYMRYAEDTEGNYFGMMEADETAKM